MANIRPAGLSDEDTDNEDDYGYDHKLVSLIRLLKFNKLF